MTDTEQLIRRYLDTWNERDHHARVLMLDEIWAPDGSYTDPLVAVQGRDAIAATIGAVQEQFPDFTFALAGAVDTHHHLARFTWELGPPGAAQAPIVGFDVAVLGPDGKLQDVHGFLDRVPT